MRRSGEDASVVQASRWRTRAWDWWTGGGIGTSSADVPVRVAEWLSERRSRPATRAIVAGLAGAMVLLAVVEVALSPRASTGVIWSPLVVTSVLVGSRATTALCTMVGLAVGIGVDVTGDVDAHVTVIDAVLRFVGLSAAAVAASFGVLAMVELSRRSRTDARTGLLNHAGFLAAMERERERAVRDASTVSLVYFDLDGLKAANDDHGHAYGDELLLRFAEHLDQCRRVVDIPARLGGDEFALLLPGTDSSGLEHVLRRLFRAIDQDSRALAVSAGAVTWANPPSVRSMLRQADQLMYRAKQGGGRCWVTLVVADAAGSRTAHLRPSADRRVS